jgi:hypothetical protein
VVTPSWPFEAFLVGDGDEAERRLDGFLVVRQQLGEVLLLGLGLEDGEEDVEGHEGDDRGDTVGPQLLDDQGASLSVVAVSSGSAAIVFTTGVMPALRRSGSRYWSERQPGPGPVAGDHPHLDRAPDQLLSPQLTVACRMAASSGPVHHR